MRQDWVGRCNRNVYQRGTAISKKNLYQIVFMAVLNLVMDRRYGRRDRTCNMLFVSRRGATLGEEDIQEDTTFVCVCGPRHQAA